MVRSKVKYEMIANEQTRRVTFKKRMTGFLKKLEEIKVLCGIDACAVVLNEDGSQSNVWPSQHEAIRVVERFRSLPAPAQTNKMLDQAGFLNQNLAQVTNNLERESKKIRSLEIELLLVDCLDKDVVDVSNPQDLHEMLRLLDSKIRVVDWRIEDIENTPSTSNAGAKENENEPNNGKGKPPLYPFWSHVLIILYGLCSLV